MPMLGSLRVIHTFNDRTEGDTLGEGAYGEGVRGAASVILGHFNIP